MKKEKEIKYKKIGTIMARVNDGNEEFLVLNKNGEVLDISINDIKNFIRTANFIK